MKNKKSIWLFIQFTLLVLLLIFFIISFFIKELSVVTNYLLSSVLLVMAYNNVNFFKRKYMTIIYGITGILLLVVTIING